MKTRSLIIVNYRTSHLVAAAVESARRSSSLPLEVVLVDNSCDDAELEALQALNVDIVIQSDRNAGYGAGINRGRAHCSGSELIMSNPDVRFSEGAIDRLFEQLVVPSVGVSGPRFSWDDGGEWLLPPADAPGLRAKAGEIAATRSQLLRGIRDRSRTRRRVRCWTASDPHHVEALSGAVLCVDTALFDMVGGFDERFHLYFEESDFTRRVKARGLRLTHVPDARCRHLFNQSAGHEPESGTTFNTSERLFFRKWYGNLADSLMSLGVDRSVPLLPAKHYGTNLQIGEPSDMFVELSPLRDFDVAAGHFPVTTEAAVPQEIISTFLGPALYGRILRRSNLELVDEFVISFPGRPGVQSGDLLTDDPC